MTEEEAHIRDELVRLEKYGITRKDFDKAREALARQWGRTASVNDTFWKLYNEWLGKNRTLDWSITLYYEMGRLASMEGKDWRPYVRQALTIHLNQLRKVGAKTVRIDNGTNDSNSCRGCKSLKGKQVSIDTALKEMPIPTLCESDFPCRCNYFDEEEWNRLFK